MFFGDFVCAGLRISDSVYLTFQAYNVFIRVFPSASLRLFEEVIFQI